MFVTLTGRIASPGRAIKRQGENGGADSVFFVTQIINGPPGRSQFIYDVLSDSPIRDLAGQVAVVDSIVEVPVVVRVRQREGRPAELSAFVVSAGESK